MKIALIVAVLNEENSIKDLLRSISRQTKKPSEIIFVDGGSSDQTVEEIKRQTKEFKLRNVKVYVKKGNRSVARNEAIKRSKSEIIICTDAGCVLNKNWVKNITKPFEYKKIQVVAGYYKGRARTIFEKCLIPYVLVMPDQINENKFLPAARSMALQKYVWKKIKGFPENLSHNEDYVFANKLKENKFKIFFEKDAIVEWIPRKNLFQAIIMFVRFAFGDAEAGIFRTKVILIFLRYLLSIYLILLSIIEHAYYITFFVIFAFLLYVTWAILKNYKYVRDKKAFILLPVLQVASDIAVMAGSAVGALKLLFIYSFRSARSYPSLITVLIAYLIVMTSMIQWGIPNLSHPFTYQMDEWHQLESVRNLFKFGSPNIPGSAHGTIFSFFLAGVYLAPFILLRIINPFLIKSSLDFLPIQEKLFIILRINTMIYGVLSLILIAYIAKKILRINPLPAVLLFSATPIWIILSNYFKYDIALIFWILLSLISIFKFLKLPSLRNYVIAFFVVGISVSVKVSAAPLIVLLFFTLLISEKVHKATTFAFGILIFSLTLLLFGIPDLFVGKGDIREFLYSNLVSTPGMTDNFKLGQSWLLYYMTRILPLDFGFVFIGLSILGVIYCLKKRKENPNIMILLAAFALFLVSLYPLKLFAGGNRSLVLLPFLALTTSYWLQKIKIKSKYYIFFLLLIIQFVQVWWTISYKLNDDIRQSSSLWIANNVKSGTDIGIENIPIYQYLPDVLLKDYYFSLKGSPHKYSYSVIDASSKKFPSVLILTGVTLNQKFVANSDEKEILGKISGSYSVVKQFQLNPRLNRVMGNERDMYLSGLIQELPITIFFRK